MMRPYQQAIVADIEAGWATHRSQLLQLATGGGKTHVAAHILKREVELGWRAVFVAHLDSLVTDTRARLTELGVWCGTIMADHIETPMAPVQVCSLQTLERRELTPPADLVVFDEAHRAGSNGARALLGRYGSSTHVLGLTATPQRSDGTGLGDLFERLVCGPTHRKLTKYGHLVPSVVYSPSLNRDRMAMDPVEAYRTYAAGRRAIVFCASVSHARDLETRFLDAGIPSECLVAETDRLTRASIRKRLETGATSVLCGVGVFLEGWDCPSVDAVILARPMLWTGSYLQAIGRGLRPSEGKTNCVVLDLYGSVAFHGLPEEDREWSLSGDPVRNTETSYALRRCGECLAVFQGKFCPRCGASGKSLRPLPRVLNRAEKLKKWESIEPGRRDALYLRKLQYVAIGRMGMPVWRAKEWAEAQFSKRFRRKPICSEPSSSSSGPSPD